MIIAAVGMVKDEADIVRSVVTHMRDECDFVIIADNGSTDGTREILDELDVIVVDDSTVAYDQSAKMTALAAVAGAAGADWVVPCDGDEWWVGRDGCLRDTLAEVAPQWLAVGADVYDHVLTGVDEPLIADPVRRIQWRRRTAHGLPKVACRTRPDLTIQMGNHAAAYEGGTTMLPHTLVVHHFPYRSVDQVVRKVVNGAAAYAASNLPEHYGAHWRQYAAIYEQGGREAIEHLVTTWFYRDDPTVPIRIGEERQEPLIWDPVD